MVPAAPPLTTGNIGTELHVAGGILRGLEDSLDGVLEGEVQGLSGEVSQDIGEISYDKKYRLSVSVLF